jgi:transcriptional regulator with XRE-family HTH domain
VNPEDVPAGEFDQLGAVNRLARERRKALGLNLRDAAGQIGMSFNSLSRVERGYAPDALGLLAILAWLGFPVAWLDDDPDLDAAAIDEQWAYWRGWQDCASAHRAAVDALAPPDPPARSAPEFERWLADAEPACSECGGRPKRGLIRSEDGGSWQCEGCYHDLAAGPAPTERGES